MYKRRTCIRSLNRLLYNWHTTWWCTSAKWLIFYAIVNFYCHIISVVWKSYNSLWEMIKTLTLHNNDTTPRHNGVESMWLPPFTSTRYTTSTTLSLDPHEVQASGFQNAACGEWTISFCTSSQLSYKFKMDNISDYIASPLNTLELRIAPLLCGSCSSAFLYSNINNQVQIFL
jgi:hypothetical protein